MHTVLGRKGVPVFYREGFNLGHGFASGYPERYFQGQENIVAHLAQT